MAPLQGQRSRVASRLLGEHCETRSLVLASQTKKRPESYNSGQEGDPKNKVIADQSSASEDQVATPSIFRMYSFLDIYTPPPF